MSWLLLILILPYILILLKCYKGLLHLEAFTISTEPSAFVSVVVACHNEEKNLPSLLTCLANQNYGEHLFEVIIVDDNSTDMTFNIAQGFKGISNMVVKNNKGQGKKLALRTGIESAKGPLIITTDADCVMGPEWIKTITAFYEAHNPVLIICPVQIHSANGFFAELQSLEFLSLQGITAGFASENESVMCNGANLAFSSETYFKHAGQLHDEIKSGDDVFLLHSLKKEKNPKILWLESSLAMVTTEPASTFSKFINQRSRWISKSPFYKDKFTIALGIVTFITIFLQFLYSIWLIINPVIATAFLTFLLLKSIPDFLILWNTAKRYKSRNLMKWFLPAQIIYPVYVLIVVIHSLMVRNK